MTRPMIVRTIETSAFRATVEELDSEKFIATLWRKKETHRHDRTVKEFETCGGAMSQLVVYLAWELAFSGVPDVEIDSHLRGEAGYGPDEGFVDCAFADGEQDHCDDSIAGYDLVSGDPIYR